jgi:plasmid maintenance system antidote protein VapI
MGRKGHWESDLAERQPVTAQMAIRLGKLCGNGPDIWYNLQKRYDMAIARCELAETVSQIPTLEAA